MNDLLLHNGGYGQSSTVNFNLIQGWNFIEIGLYNGLGPSALYLGDGISRSDFGLADVPGVTLNAFSAPVPEPSTWLLLGGGLIGLAWYEGKRKKV